MALGKNRFTRKLSAEEIKGNFITVQKKDLDFFPRAGKPFELHFGDKDTEAYVQAVACWCQGPKKPHSHYRIDLTPFRGHVRMRWGSNVVIEKAGDKKYNLVT